MLNNTTDPGCGFGGPMTDKIAAKIAAYALIITASVLGNLLICLVVYKNRDMRSTINYIIVNVALSDILIPVFAISRQVHELSSGSFAWPMQGALGNFLCKFVYFIADLSPVVSIASLVFLTTERFTAVYFPFEAWRVHPKLRKCFIGLTWLIAAAFCSPHFYTFRLSDSGCCIMSWEPAFDNATARDVYISVLLILFILIPFTYMAVVYSLILYKLRTKPKHIKQSKSERKKRKRMNRNVTLLSFGIVVAFGLCWGPYFTVLTVVSYVWNWDFTMAPRNWETFWFTAQYLSYANTAVNPLLCLIFMKNYREGAKKVFTRAIPKHKRGSQSLPLTPKGSVSNGKTKSKSSRTSRSGQENEYYTTTV